MAARSEYMAAPSFARTSASNRGWGSGWPNCQPEKMGNFDWHDGWNIRVRGEVLELVKTLFIATEEKHGYRIKPGETWSYNCRAISGTNSPSNHSWGLAVDINAPTNPMSSTFRSDMPPSMIPMWWEAGWYWGGWYGSRPDAMHFEYMYRPGDVARHLEIAKGYLGATSSTEDEIMKMGDQGPAVAQYQWHVMDFLLLTGGLPAEVLNLGGTDKVFWRDGDYGPQTAAATRHAVDRLTNPNWKLWGWGEFNPSPHGEIVTPGTWAGIREAAMFLKRKRDGWA